MVVIKTCFVFINWYAYGYILILSTVFVMFFLFNDGFVKMVGWLARLVQKNLFLGYTIYNKFHAVFMLMNEYINIIFRVGFSDVLSKTQSSLTFSSQLEANLAVMFTTANHKLLSVISILFSS